MINEISTANLDNMTVSEFQEYLPELFETSGGSISKDPRFTIFFEKNPDCAALVRDLETIAEQAKSLFQPSEEPADSVWDSIASKLKSQAGDEDEDPTLFPEPLANGG